MPLDLPDGTHCFVDSNIFYYGLVPTPDASQHCLDFLDRVIKGRVRISASIPVLSDVLHKVMISEVAQVTGRTRAGLIGYLGKHPEIIRGLREYPQAMERLKILPMEILPLDQDLLAEASKLAVQEGMLTSDAVIAAQMRRHSIRDLVTNDDDFDSTAWLKIWKPR